MLVRSLLISPYGIDLSTLNLVLEQTGLDVKSSERIGAGLQLADADLRGFDAAIAILPDDHNPAGLPAVLVEVGIVAGRSLPLLVVVPPGQHLPAALATARCAKTSLDNREALQLHVSLFVGSLRSEHEQESPRPPDGLRLSPEAAARFNDRLRGLRGSSRRARDLERFVIDLLRASGAHVEEAPTLPTGRQVDAAASIPGEEHRLGLFLVEVKSHPNEKAIQAAELQLQSYVIESGGGLGLLVHDAAQGPERHSAPPLVLSLPVERLVADLERASLAQVLVRARNEAVHRM